MIKAALTADFHLSIDPQRSSAVIPALKYQPQLMDAFFDHVRKLNPDLLLVLGDNTASGQYRDMRKLKEYLLTLDQAGIGILMIPGNHDFDRGSEETYEKMFFPLMKPDCRDSASLSFSKTIKDVLFLAMDDHAGSRSPAGVLKEQTIAWLQEQLTAAERNNLRTVFLSHHQLIHEAWQANRQFYCLQPETVLPLLQEHGVRLAFSGHAHDAAIRRSRDFHEVTVPMPADGSHQYGLLHITADGADYSLHQLSFESPLWEYITETDRIDMESKKAVFARMIENSSGPQPEMLEVLMAFHKAHIGSVLYDRKEQIRSMPAYKETMAALGNGIYRRWIECLLSDDRLPQNRLRIHF